MYYTEEEKMLKVKNISYAVKKKQLVKDVSFDVNVNEFVVIMGANGAGKSTLLKIIAASLEPSQGEVELNKIPLTTYSAVEIAKCRAVLSQHYSIAFPASVKEIVMMGRYPYFINNPTSKDEAIVEHVLHQMQVYDFVDRDYNTLSGGEAQKVQMSRVLAQIGQPTIGETSKLLLLDEPVSHLDIKYQHQLLNVAKEYCTKNMAVVAVLHDINLALKYADRILFMKQGSIINTLLKEEAVTPALLNNVFDVEARILLDEEGKQVVVF